MALSSPREFGTRKTWHTASSATLGASQPDDRISCYPMNAELRVDKVSPEGLPMTMAKLRKVALRAVKCTPFGGTLKIGKNSEDYSHVKVQFDRMELKELRAHAEGGESIAMDVTLLGDRVLLGAYGLKLKSVSCPGGVARLTVKLNGKSFPVTLNGDGQLEFCFPKEEAQLPASARLWVQYLSPLGGTWFVDNHNLMLDFQERETQNACCSIM